jgi:hypothetical protein
MKTSRKINKYKLLERTNTAQAQQCYRYPISPSIELQGGASETEGSTVEKGKERWRGKGMHVQQSRNIDEKKIRG